MRDTSFIQTALTYVTFLVLSVAVHVIVILGNRPLEPRAPASSTATSTEKKVDREKSVK